MNALMTSIGMAPAPRAPDQGFVDGSDLLKDLSGDNGEAMRSVAVGYVMAIHDALRTAPAAGAHAPAPAVMPTLEQHAQRVEQWLRANPQRRHEVAATLVRAALGAPAAAGAAPPVRLRSGARRSWPAAWGRAGLLGGTGAAALVLALGAVFVRGVPTSATTDPLVRNVAIIEGADNITRLVLEERRYEKDSFLNVGNPDRFARYSAKWSDARTALAGAVAHLAALDLNDADRRMLVDIEGELHEYAQGFDQILADIQNDRIRTPQDANQQFSRFKRPVQRIEELAGQIKTHADRSIGVTA